MKNTCIKINSELIDLSIPHVMGVINLTPDSFYSGSRQHDIATSLDMANNMVEQRANIIDVGAQSTRPGADMLSVENEWSRLEPFLKAFREKNPKVLLSVDTFWAEVAKRAVENYDVNIINDISGGSIDKNMFNTIAKLDIAYILMHMRGTPVNMMQKTLYNNIVNEIISELAEKVKILRQKGIHNIIVDPGFGFAKNIEQNYTILNHLNDFKILDCPILVGLSRKSMIWKLLKITPEESLTGTIACNSIALQKGANIIRVHDVIEARQTINIFNATQTSLINDGK